MKAYAPEGMANISDHNSTLFGYSLLKIKTEYFNPFTCAFIGGIFEKALDNAVKYARSSKRHQHSRSELAAICRCSEEDYSTKWRFTYYKLKDALIDLDARALPPVARKIWETIGRV